MPQAADRAKDATIGEAAGRAQQEVMRAGREKVQQSATRWRRVTDGNPCGFCAMVASRGPAYRSAEAAGQGRRYHNKCGCTVEPFEGDPGTWKPNADEQRFVDAYDAVRKPGMSPEAVADEMGKILGGASDLKPSLEGLVGRLVGVTPDMAPARLTEAAAKIKDLTDRHGVPINYFEIGNTAAHGKQFVAAGDASPGGVMHVTAKAFRPKWEAWERGQLRSAEAATSAGGGALSGLESLIVHEYGHLIDFYTGKKLSVTRISKALARQKGITGSDFDLWRSRQISLYGRTSREEAIAEAFADVEIHGDRASELSQAIVSELLRLLRATNGTPVDI